MAAKPAVFTLFLAAALAAQTPGPPRTSGLDLASLDRTVRPQDDLFRFVNGGWLARTPIPGDRVTYGTFAELSDRPQLAKIAHSLGEGSRAAGRLPLCDGCRRSPALLMWIPINRDDSWCESRRVGSCCPIATTT